MKLSVVVCTHNRAHAIVPCLDSILESLTHAAPIDAEIVVVNNASEDNTSEVVREWSKKSAFPINLQYEAKKGISSARNRGLRTVQGDLIVFTDDDCCLSKNHIVEALQHDATDEEPVLRGGRVDLGNPEDLAITVKTSPATQRWSRKLNSARHTSMQYGLVGCNVVMRRDVVRKIGFYDERFGVNKPIPAGEDTDYFFRAYHADIPVEYVPDMAVTHYHGRKTLAEGRRLIKGYIVGLGAIYAKFLFIEPNLCRPAIWDLKNALREIISGKNGFMPELGISYKQLVGYCLLGAFKYAFLSLKKST